MTATSLRLRLRTGGPAATRALGAALATALRPGDVVLLAGDLGAGKTTLTQGIAAGLGVTDVVTSPTFTLVRSHPCRPGAAPGVRELLHADLYRLDQLAEVADLGLGELVEEGAVAVVEWGDVAAPLLGPGALVVVLADTGDDERVLELRAEDGWSDRAEGLGRVLEPWAAR